MKSYKSESTIRPQAWDKESSECFVYHNKNIVEIPSTEDMPTMYQYDVEEYTNKEYINLMDGNISDNTNAILELAEIIMEG